MAVGRQGGERAAPDPRVGRRHPRALAEHGRQRCTCVGRQLLDRLGESGGSPVGPVEGPGDGLLREAVQVARRKKATVERPLEVLPPEGARLVERGAGDEEPRHRARAPEDRRGLREVAREVVVERQRDRDAPATPAGRRSGLQGRRRDDRVAPREVADLLLERGAADRGDDLRLPVARLRRHAVVDEDDADPAARRTGEPPKGEAAGLARELPCPGGRHPGVGPRISAIRPSSRSAGQSWTARRGSPNGSDEGTSARGTVMKAAW